MKNYNDRLAAAGHSATGTADAAEGRLFPRVYLPKAVYEALPTAYVSAGSVFIAGAFYLGIGYGLSAGYLSVGLYCVLAGLSVSSIRRAERAK